MAWYPGAKKMELQPESDAQPAIRPTQFIVHSIVAPWTPQRTYEYWRDSTNLESHFGLGYDGSLGQFIGTQTRADANAAANRRADGTGAVSLESASNLQASDPWTDAQVEALIKLGVWLHQTHGIPLRICRTADDPGFGYHRLHAAWNPDAHDCPGDARVRQFHQVVFPGIVARAAGTTTPPKEDDVALTDTQAAQLADIAAKIKTVHDQRQVAPWQYKGTNVTLDAYAHLRGIYADVKQLLADAGGVELSDAQLTALADKVASAPGLADAIAEKVAEKLAARLAQ